MDQLLELINIKTEPNDSTASDQEEIPTEMQLNSVKQERDCVGHSEIYIKMEQQENENEFGAVPSLPYQLCSNYNMKIKTGKPTNKIECGDLVDELMQDPLGIVDKIKDEKHFPSNLDQGESGIITKLIEKQKDENLLEINKDDSHSSKSNQGQHQLLIRNTSVRKDKKYMCSVCNRTFGHKGNFNKHLRSHSSKRSFSCDVCKKSFNRKSHLNEHMLIHSGEKPHICDVCQKAFNQKSTLHSHKFFHSGKKPFSCKECNKSFARKPNLVTHERVHIGDKPYSCDQCKKSFTEKSNLIKHRRLHTGEKPFSCEVCSKSFADKSNLNQHRKIHKN